MEQTTKAEDCPTGPQSAKQSDHQDADEQAGQAASIAEICTAIAKLVAAVNTAGAEQGPQNGYSDLTEGQADALWESVGDFAAQLARARSSSLDDISGKISIWRRLAPEQGAENRYPTIDETLLFSIMDDVERLRLGQTG